jgi:hypothetical protein
MGVPPGSEIQAPPATFVAPCARADRPASGRGPSGRQAGNPSPVLGRGPFGPWPRTIRPYAESIATVRVE